MIQAESRFEDRLLTELKQIVAVRATAGSGGALAPRPVSSGRRVSRRRLALVSGFGAVGATASVVFALMPGGGQPAYAVSTNPDGTVTVTANYLGSPAEANQQLRRAGVSAVVLPAVPAADCPAADRGTTVPGADGGSDTPMLVTHMGTSKRVQVRWQRNDIDPGKLLVLAPQVDQATGEMVMTIDYYYQPGPRCVVAGTAGLVPVPVESVNAYDTNPSVATQSPKAPITGPVAVSPSPNTNSRTP
jgi:hypothetical protein